MNFDKIGKQHVSRRRKPSPLRKKRSADYFDASFPQQVWPRSRYTGNAYDTAPEQRPAKARSAGFSIPLSWIKNLSIAAGILVVGLVGTNWDSIAKTFKLQEISVKTLEDAAPYRIMDASFEPIIPWEMVRASDEPLFADPAITISAAAVSAAVSHEALPLNLTETFAWSEYVVRQGDTISGIASKHSLYSGSIIAFNSIKEAWNIRAGRVLKIPNMDGIPYTVEKNDSLSKIAVKMKVPQNAILDANNIMSDTIRPGEVLFIPGAKMDANEFSRAYQRDAYQQRNTGRGGAAKPMAFPVNGRITSAYGWREDPVRPRPGEKTFHKAIDIAGKMGDPVKAAMNGTVLHIDNNPNLGNFILLKHGEYQTLYAHLSAYSVKAGDEVRQGQEIGKVGSTGYTTGPHLHFEAFHHGNRINPLDLLK